MQLERTQKELFGKIHEDMLDKLADQEAPQVNVELTEESITKEMEQEVPMLLSPHLAARFSYLCLEILILIFIQIKKEKHQIKWANLFVVAFERLEESSSNYVLVGLSKSVSLSIDFNESWLRS